VPDEQFATRPADLTAGAARVDEAAGVVADAVASLRATLGALGGFLGTDEQGRSFAAQYDPTSADGLTTTADEAGGLRSLADALRASAHDYAAGDSTTTAAMRPPPPG
jgi:carbohydrate-selective porin OprB